MFRLMFRLSLSMLAVLFIFISFSALIIKSTIPRDVDIIKEIQQFKDEGRRDDALTATSFMRKIEPNNEELIELEDELKYNNKLSMMKSIFWNGAVKGEVYDSFSGFGAISSDLCVFGDFRDIVIQSNHYINENPKFDKITAALSVVGVGLSTAAVIDGVNSVGKNSLKFTKKVPSLKTGMIKKLEEGKTQPKNFQEIWKIFKNNKWNLPTTVSCLSKINTRKELKSVNYLLKNHKGVGTNYINLTKGAGVKLFSTVSLPSREIIISAFKTNPKAIIGLTKSGLVVRSVKILNKHGALAFMLPLATLTPILPASILIIIIVLSLGLLAATTKKKKKVHIDN